MAIDVSAIFGSDLAGWWKASDVTDADNTSESTWKSRGGSLGGDFTASVKPTIQTVTANGKTYRVMRFSANSYMQSPWIPSGPLAIFIVAKDNVSVTSSNQVHALVTTGPAGAAPTSSLRLDTANTFVPPIGNYFYDDSGNAILYLDGTPSGSRSGGNAGTSWHVFAASVSNLVANDKLTLAVYTDLSFFGPLDIAEVIAVSAVPTDVQRSQTDNYLSSEYGIPLTRVSAFFTSQWSAASQTVLTPQFAFGINQKVTATPQFKWNVSSTVRVTVTPQLEWNVSQYIQKTFDFQWNTDAIVTRVAITENFIWNTRQQILVQNQIKWAVFQQIIKSLNAQWQIRALIELQYQLNWGVRQAITGSPNLKWSISVIEGLIGIYQWGIAQTLSKTHEFDWSLASHLPVEFTCQWQTFTRIVVSPLLAWQARALANWGGTTEPSDSVYTDIAAPSTTFLEIGNPSNHWSEL